MPFGVSDRLGLYPVKGAYSWTAWEGSRTKSLCVPQTTPTRKPGKAWLRPRRKPAAVEPLSSSPAGDTWVGLTHLGPARSLNGRTSFWPSAGQNLICLHIVCIDCWKGAIRASASPHVWNCSVLHNLWSCVFRCSLMRRLKYYTEKSANSHKTIITKH